MVNYYRLTTRDDKEVKWVFPFILMWFIGYCFIVFLSDNNFVAEGLYFVCYLILFVLFQFKIEKQVFDKR